MSDTTKTFLGRWSQRKIKAREVEAAELAAAEAATAAAEAAAEAATAAAEAAAIAEANAAEFAAGAQAHAAQPQALKQENSAASGVAPAPSGSAAEASAGSTSPSPTSADAARVSAPAPLGGPNTPALPSLADVAKLTSESDYSVFMAKGVAPEVKNAAMKKLFADPHYNIMDGLDIYIDDYSSPEIMPASMLRKMASARVMNLFTDEDEAKAVAADLAAAEAEADADAANRRPDATAHPRPAADVLASAPRPDVPRAGDGLTVDPAAASRISSPSGDS